jgi:hypothetical protein
MIATDAGKRSFSDIPALEPSSGTSTIPPPAPNKPFTAPAAIPARGSLNLPNKNTSCGKDFPGRCFYAKKSCALKSTHSFDINRS